jgi:predicted secreted Zn-dependent protease
MNHRWLTYTLLSLLFSNSAVARDAEENRVAAVPPPPQFVVAGAAPGQISLVYYEITGTSLAELDAAMGELGPTDNQGTRRHAFAAWHMTWRWPRSKDGAPDFSRTKVECTGTVTVPRWSPPANTAPSLIEAWERYLAALLRHESRHLEHCFAERERVSALLARASREDPSLTPAAANGIVREVLKEIHARDRAYDVTTSHGRTEGVQLIPPQR